MTAVRTETRARIVEVAAGLLRDHGPAAVTTRGVAEAAGVQAPTIYRLFGDKDGLLDAVAEHVMTGYVDAKAGRAAATASADPLEELREGWRAQIEFGLANPTLFRLLSDPERVRTSAAARAGKRVLELRVHRIALAGRLRVPESRAVDVIQAAGIGVVHTLLSRPAGERDATLPDAIYDGVLAQILDAEPTEPTVAADGLAAVVAVRAMAPDLAGLSCGERALLGEWLDRVVAGRKR